MIPSLSFIKEAFSRFNISIFNSELPTPKFALTKARTFRGKLVYSWKSRLGRRVYSDFEIRLSISFYLRQEEWEDVVIHEMIHYYITYKRLKDTSSHGPLFRKMMHAINTTHGRNISISTRSTDEQREPDRQVRAHYLCLGRLSDGRLGVAPVAKTRLHELWERMPTIPGVEAVKWVGAIDPWFNRFPRVMTPKLYLSSDEEALPHLKGGVILEKSGNVIRPAGRRFAPEELLP